MVYSYTCFFCSLSLMSLLGISFVYRIFLSPSLLWICSAIACLLVFGQFCFVAFGESGAPEGNSCFFGWMSFGNLSLPYSFPTSVCRWDMIYFFVITPFNSYECDDN